jgi:hypothetical protein
VHCRLCIYLVNGMEYVYWGWRLESKINLVCGILCKVQLILSVYRIPVTPENDKVRN